MPQPPGIGQQPPCLEDKIHQNPASRVLFLAGINLEEPLAQIGAAHGSSAQPQCQPARPGIFDPSHQIIDLRIRSNSSFGSLVAGCRPLAVKVPLGPHQSSNQTSSRRAGRDVHRPIVASFSAAFPSKPTLARIGGIVCSRINRPSDPKKHRSREFFLRFQSGGVVDSAAHLPTNNTSAKLRCWPNDYCGEACLKSSPCNIRASVVMQGAS